MPWPICFVRISNVSGQAESGRGKYSGETVAGYIGTMDQP